MARRKKVPWPDEVWAVRDREYPEEGTSVMRSLPKGIEEDEDSETRRYVPAPPTGEVTVSLSREEAEALSMSPGPVAARQVPAQRSGRDKLRAALGGME